MEICPHNKCTGCSACINACNHNCISMQEDEMGALHPVINERDCIHCNLCIKSCPNNIELEFKYPQECIASWITNKEKRRICASGGIGTILSEYTIKQKGIVFGSRYNKNMTPIITYTDTLEDLEYFKGSRYVQSIIGEKTFQQVRIFLKKGCQVLYIGTPCQIAGLKTFLHQDYKNLITVDLICHGVCPTKYFKEEIDYLSKKNNYKDITDIRFRGNDRNNYCLSIWNKQKLLYRGFSYCQFYLAGFLLGVSLRENCYTCNYARPERISDITIGDFIGLGKIIPFLYPKKNVSSVMINTPKGEEFYKKVSDYFPSLINVKRSYKERLKYKPSLCYAFPRHELNATFARNYKHFGYVKGIRKTLGKYIIKKKAIKIINYWRYIYRIPKIIYKVLLNKPPLI